MARYFLHVREADGSLNLDHEGEDFADLDAACAEAVNSSREMLGERLLHGGKLGPRQIEIADESGTVLAAIAAEDVLMHDGQFCAFSDDVTKSAPASSISNGTKPPAE